MKMLRSLIIICFMVLKALTLSHSAVAQTSPNPQNIINVHSLGAICDGTSHLLKDVFNNDEASAQTALPNVVTSSNWSITQNFEIDTAAIDQAAFFAGHQSSSAGGTFLTAQEGLIVMGTGAASANGTCLINSTLNFTSASGRPIHFDARGAVMLCTTASAPCMDMTGTIGMDVLGLTIVGSNSNSLPPTIGILMGRQSDAMGSTYNTFEHLTLDGLFSFADFVNVAGEDTTIDSGVFSNGANGNSNSEVFGVVLDGQNFFHSCSNFPSVTCIIQYDTNASFNTFECNQCKVLMAGTYAVPVWASNTRGHRWTGAYLRSSASSAGPCIQLNFSHNTHNTFDSFDAHCEGSMLGSIFEIDGQDNQVPPGGLVTSPSVNSLAWREHTALQSGPIFKLGPDVTSATITDASIDMGIFLTGSTNQSWFDTPANYTVSGVLSGTTSQYFTPPGTFNGWACMPGCMPYGTATLSPAAWQVPLTVTELMPAGGLSSLALPAQPKYIFSASGFPSVVTVAPPNLAGGAQAAASITSYRIGGYGTPAQSGGGTGYAVNDTITYGNAAGYTCTTYPMARISGVSGGAVTSISARISGVCSVWPATSTITNLATSGSGTGLTLNSPSYFPLSVSISAIGSGYTTPPSVTLVNGDVLTSQIASPLTLDGPVIFRYSGSSGSGQSGGFSTSISATWSAPLSPPWGSVLKTAGGSVYQVVGPSPCTTAAGDAPTAGSGFQTTADGCVWKFLSSSGAASQIQAFDSTILFPECLTLAAIDSMANANVQACAGAGSPSGKVLAPVGSTYADSMAGGLWQNTTGTLSGWAQLAAYPAVGIPVSSGTSWAVPIGYLPSTAFTPTVTPTITGNWTVAYGAQTGIWSRMGQQVCIKERVVFTPTFTTATGNLQFSLPAALANDIDAGLTVTNLGTLPFLPASGASPVMLGKSGQSYAVLTFLSSGAAATPLTAASVTSGSTYTVQFNGCYSQASQ